MSKAIFKYPLAISDNQTLELPVGFTGLSVGEQNGQLVMWALIDKDQTRVETVNIRIYGTGHPIEIDTDQYKFLGTVPMGPFVWHVFIY